MSVSMFLGMHTSYEITELMALEKIDGEDKQKATREAELETRARAKNQQLKAKRGR